MRLIAAVLLLCGWVVAQEHKIGVAKHKMPVYPPIAKMARVQGTVAVNFLLNPDGTIKESKVISGHPMLVHAVTEVAKQWRFTCMDCAYGEGFEHTVEFSRVKYGYRECPVRIQLSRSS